MRIALVSCVKSKRDTPARAKDLYTSPLFRSLRAYAESHADAWYILSARYGLVDPDRMLEPYELTLNTMSRAQREQWAEHVTGDLAQQVPLGASIIVLAGTRYREKLVPFLRARGHDVTVPLEGLSFGRQLQRLKVLNA